MKLLSIAEPPWKCECWEKNALDQEDHGRVACHTLNSSLKRDFSNMLYLHIFIDGSVNSQLKIGYGAYLVVSELGAAIESLKDTVRVKRFEHTNSTKLELQTLLWALSETVALGSGGDMVLTV
ncbi:MAG TPA: hypothetical protein PK517_06065 [Nitrosomonas sp.]|nr:hypothetical protein [Nitrosomonas sp.]